MNLISFDPSKLPEVINLLKESLGEGSTPKTEAFFRWKHFENPFGKSIMLLAMEGDELIGIRCFMQWQWIYNTNSVLRAVRAVDTATSPNYQGKGVFSKLTMAAVELSEQEGLDFIFNTPNSASRKGYLKMGWTDAGKMPFWVMPGALVPAMYSSERQQEIISKFSNWEAIREMDLAHAKRYSDSEECLVQPITAAYLYWRYKNCPVVNYGIAINDSALVIFRLKKFGELFELRICDYFIHEFASIVSIKELIISIKREVRPLVVTVAPGINNSSQQLLPGAIKFKTGWGPIVTIRSLNGSNTSHMKNFERWAPSIGSLELF